MRAALSDVGDWEVRQKLDLQTCQPGLGSYNMNSPQPVSRRRFMLAPGRQPVLFAPRIIILLIVTLAIIHLLRVVLAPGLDRFLVVMLGVLPIRYLADSGRVVLMLPGGPGAAAAPFLTYAFLHANFIHLLINSAWLLAFGTTVARRLGAWRFLLFYGICAVAGALLHVLLNPGSTVPMVGASGAISGLMGAAFRISLPAILDEGDRRLRSAVAPLTDRRFLTMSGVWIVSNVIFGITGIRVTEQVLLIAWDAHIGGFVAGALLIGVFVRWREKRR